MVLPGNYLQHLGSRIPQRTVRKGGRLTMIRALAAAGLVALVEGHGAVVKPP